MHRLRSLSLVAPLLLGACSLINAPAEIDPGTTTGGGGTGGTTGGGGTGGTTSSGGTGGTTSTPTDECGDGKMTGAEACDDDNTNAGDGCSPTCTVEAGFACTGEPSVCVPSCGNGTLDPGEECDDHAMGDVNPPPVIRTRAPRRASSRSSTSR